MKKLIKADIKGLTALQACMASILCQVNGVDSAYNDENKTQIVF